MGAVTGGRGIFFLEIGRDLELFLIDILSWAFREDEKKKKDASCIVGEMAQQGVEY